MDFLDPRPNETARSVLDTWSYSKEPEFVGCLWISLCLVLDSSLGFCTLSWFHVSFQHGGTFVSNQTGCVNCRKHTFASFVGQKHEFQNGTKVNRTRETKTCVTPSCSILSHTNLAVGQNYVPKMEPCQTEPSTQTCVTPSCSILNRTNFRTLPAARISPRFCAERPWPRR